MRAVKFLLMLFMISALSPIHAADETPPQRAERSQREAVKLSPRIRSSPLPRDENGKTERAMPMGQSPLQNVPALMGPPPGAESTSKP